ncbi:MAG: hypothetical protein FJ225_12090 [Lentisphaerae bacterium]|nr:hypothetical protein [Lentisphaerota bacterium]
MEFKRTALGIVAAVLACAPAARAWEDDETPSVCEALTGHSGEVSLLRFYNQRGFEQSRRYVTRLSMDFEGEMLSWRRRDYLMLGTSLASDFGRSIAPLLPFSPMDAVYGIAPFWENRGRRILRRAGWDHACAHLILKEGGAVWYDREDVNVPSSAYFNRVFAGVGTTTMRRAAQARSYRLAPPPGPAERIVWYAEAGGYVRGLGGVLSPSAFQGGSDWAWDVALEARHPLLIRTAWALVAGGSGTALVDSRDRPSWRARLELEFMPVRNALGLSLFGAWNPVDRHPYDSREGLGEVGVRAWF